MLLKMRYKNSFFMSRHNAAGLKSIALEFILRNIQDSAIIQRLTDLKSEPDLLVEIIKGNTLHRPAEASPLHGPFGNGSEWSGTRR